MRKCEIHGLVCQCSPALRRCTAVGKVFDRFKFSKPRSALVLAPVFLGTGVSLHPAGALPALVSRSHSAIGKARQQAMLESESQLLFKH
jgi:hypothetical protein